MIMIAMLAMAMIAFTPIFSNLEYHDDVSLSLNICNSIPDCVWFASYAALLDSVLM